MIGSSFVRWADITSIAPKEHEDDNAVEYKVIYLEMNFEMHGGLNNYAVHLVQEESGNPWEITMLGGAPWLEK